MSYIQLPYGVADDNKPKIKLNLPRNYRAGEYFKKLPYLNHVKDPAFQNSVVDIVNNRDLHKLLLAMSDIRRNINENLNAAFTNGKFNDAIVWHGLDTAGKNVLPTRIPYRLLSEGVKKFNAQNPKLGNLLTKMEGNKLSDEEIKKNSWEK